MTKKCDICNGKGWVIGECHPQSCGECAGTGEVLVRHWYGNPCGGDWSAWHYEAAKAVCIAVGGTW